MREIHKVIEAYSFDELDVTVQNKVLDKLYYINADYDWYDCTLDDFHTILDNIGIDCPKNGISYSGFSSQGDGLSFTGRYYYCKGALSWIKKEFPQWTALHNDVKALQDIQSRYFYRISGDIYRIGYHYSHENTVKFGDSDFSEEIEDGITEILRDIMQEFYTHLEHEYEYLTSREVIIETIKANEYEFDSEGNIIW